MGSLRAEVGALIRHHRLAAGVTQTLFAERIAKSVELIGRIERGVTAPSFETLEAMSQVLGVPVRDFFPTVSSAAGGANEGWSRLMLRASHLAPEDVDWVDRLVAVALSRKVRGAGGVK